MLYRDEQVSLVPVLQIRSLWYRNGKLSEQKKIWIAPLQYSAASDDIAFGNLPSQQVWLCGDLMKNLFLTEQSPLVHSRTRVTNLEGVAGLNAQCWRDDKAPYSRC